MNYQNLLRQRTALLRQARLANIAFAHERLRILAARIARARLSGEVSLRPADPSADLPWPELIATEGSQAVIEEYFLDDDIFELTDILAFLNGDATPAAHTFRLEELETRFLPALRRELARAGVDPGPEAPHIEDSNLGRG